MHKVRPVVIDGDTARITLTQGQVAVIDAADVDLVAGRLWFAVQNRDTQSYYAKTGARRPDGGRTTQQMSRLILAAEPGQFVDHISHDTLDNRRANLRIAARARDEYICIHYPSEFWTLNFPESAAV
jgi:hypothetical protein